MKMHQIFPIVVAIAVGLVACGSDEGVGVAGSTEESASALVSSDPSGAWVLRGGPRDPIEGWNVTVEIEDDRIGGTAACNGYGGTIEFADGTMAVSELGSNDMGCRSDVQTLEKLFLESLGAATTYSVAGDQLEITTPAGVWRFERLAPVPTVELVGRT